MAPSAVQSWREAIFAAELDSSAKLVGLVLAQYANGEGRAWPSRATIAGAASLGLRTVDRSVRRLEDAGLLEVVRAGPGAGRKVTNRYRAVIPNSAVMTLFEVEPNGRIASLATGNSVMVTPELERELEEPRARVELVRAARREFMAGLEARA